MVLTTRKSVESWSPFSCLVSVILTTGWPKGSSTLVDEGYHTWTKADQAWWKLSRSGKNGPLTPFGGAVSIALAFQAGEAGSWRDLREPETGVIGWSS